MSEKTENEWPDPPDPWQPVMTAVQCCQYLHLDDGRGVGPAKQVLRHIRRTRGLKSCSRIGKHVLFRRETVDQWLAEQEELGNSTSDEISPDTSNM